MLKSAVFPLRLCAFAPLREILLMPTNRESHAKTQGRKENSGSQRPLDLAFLRDLRASA